MLRMPGTALRGAGFGPQPAGAPGWVLYLLLCGAGCGPNQCRAGRTAGRRWQNMRGGPNYIVAGRMRTQLFEPAQFLSKCAHCLCVLVVPDSPLCLC